MNILNQLFYIGPFGVIVNFDTGEQDIAMRLAKERAVMEDPITPPPSYHSDPLIIEPMGFIIRTENGEDDIVLEETRDPIGWVLWQGMDGQYYMVQPHHCYDITHCRPLI